VTFPDEAAWRAAPLSPHSAGRPLEHALPVSGGEREKALPNAWRRTRLRRAEGQQKRAQPAVAPINRKPTAKFVLPAGPEK
jgi:hypothetical protein